MFAAKPERPMNTTEVLKLFLAVHWKGVVCVLTPLILLLIVLPLPAQGYQWCGYTLILMAVYWVTECVPLAITSFLPIIIFPFANIMTTTEVCKQYVNDTILMFVGSLILAYSIEQSGLHKRLAYAAIHFIGYSHLKLLLAICIVTTFISMWITNTAATTMMVPINFAILRVFEGQNLLKIYTVQDDGETVASDITTCYFCAASFSATIGGIGTLIGTATNLAFKGLFISAYPTAPELLSFPLFSAFSIPYVIAMEVCLYLFLAIYYFGLFRPTSTVAKETTITPQGMQAAKLAIMEDKKKMGSFSMWEGMVLVLFSAAMVCFFSRSPQIFKGWGDIIIEFYDISDKKYIRDSALAMFVCFLMFALPSSLIILQNFKAKFHDALPKGRITSVLDWKRLNATMPWSFMFLLGGGFSLSDAANKTGLNSKIGESLQAMKALPNIMIILILTIVVVFITNFASNVAVANVMVPLAMQMAKELKYNPMWYCMVAGLSASYCFMLPVGTPGNLVIQGAAKIPTKKMIEAGSMPTITTILLTWLFMFLYAPVIWPSLKEVPDWAKI